MDLFLMTNVKSIWLDIILCYVSGNNYRIKYDRME
jgi:hypothetical protein